MGEKKMTINLSTLIILFLILLIILIGALCFILLFNNETTENTEATQFPQNIINYFNDTVPSNTASNNIVSNNNVSTGNIQGKTSSKSNPLPINQWGIASKYSDGQYVDVPVKVSNIEKGNSAIQRIKSYCENSSVYKYEDADEGSEWVVVDYNIDLTNIKGIGNVKDLYVDRAIVGTADNINSVVYNNHSYYITTIMISSRDTKETIGTGSFAFQMPIGCTDYLIVLGSNSKTQAFFVGN